MPVATARAGMAEVKGFGAKLRQIREEKGLTQQQLADLAGVTNIAISRWETGEREPLWSSVVALARALDVDCTAFLGEKP